MKSEIVVDSRIDVDLVEYYSKSFFVLLLLATWEFRPMITHIIKLTYGYITINLWQ